MRYARPIIRLFTLLARLGAGLAFAVLISAVLVQVVGRTVGSSPVWTEELTRFALLYLVAFGAGLSLRTGDLVNVDAISESLPGKLPWLLRLISALATAGLALYLLPHAWKYVSIGKMQTAPALGVRMDVAHLTVFILLTGLALFAVLRCLAMLSGAEDGTPEKPDEEA
ncbi:TRAP transporter small permease [Vannielia litorea]|uniref:TRAP transporter small permease n=1 Tax=Vannielia litorea TaxID=1217970 RepID=UPI001BCF1BF0|nr:TRAP transporter small permease [Vannielia litorea]MBS8225712.1 TRAP transporter small permease [Vannielia litorea]